MMSKQFNFLERRSELSEKVLDNSAIIVASSPVKSRVSDTDYLYRQDSNFYYLSGYEEPESILLIRPYEKNDNFIIFCRDRDPLKEQWDGFRSGQKGAIEDFDADKALSISSVDSLMPELLEGAQNIYYSMSSPCGLDTRISTWIDQIRLNTRAGAEPPQNLLSLDSVIHEMRLLKSDEEITVMKQAAEITTEAHIRAMKAVKPGMFEYQLEAEYLYAFNKNGARSPAYNSIVGGGNNACILHYVENNSELKDFNEAQAFEYFKKTIERVLKNCIRKKLALKNNVEIIQLLNEDNNLQNWEDFHHIERDCEQKLNLAIT